MISEEQTPSIKSVNSRLAKQIKAIVSDTLAELEKIGASENLTLVKVRVKNGKTMRSQSPKAKRVRANTSSACSSASSNKSCSGRRQKRVSSASSDFSAESRVKWEDEDYYCLLVGSFLGFSRNELRSYLNRETGKIFSKLQKHKKMIECF
jgi:AraC-like DNA-binding protein